MRKILLSFVTLFAVSAAQAGVGDDLTSQYLKNADFSQGEVVEGFLCTYDYDMPGKSAERFGQQAVEGWTAVNLSDNIQQMQNSGDTQRTDGANARAAGLFAITGGEETAAKLGGDYFAPAETSTGAPAGQVLGMVAVWGASVQYTQEVTLPAGAYTLTYTVQNTAGNDALKANLCGFIATDGTAYLCEETTLAVGEWTEMSVTFLLAEETSGVVSVGMAGNGGSGGTAHLFFESVKMVEADAAALMKEMVDALKESELMPLLEAGDELGVSTSASWAVYNDPNATLEQVQQAITNQKALNEAGMTDFTEIFIKNAHFAQGTPLDGGVCTYDYDVEKNAGQGGKYFGMQPVEKWTANAPGENARAAGLFAVGSGDKVWVGGPGFTVPASKANGDTEGNLFGFISVWTASSYYKQSATLPAGTYTITIPTYNGGGKGAVAKNQCGFVTEDGMEYLAETTTFAEGKWTNETIKFTLDEETRGEFRIGYEAANAGSGSMPHLFVDEFTLKYNGVLNNPSLLALRVALNASEDYVEMLCEQALLDKLDEVVQAGSALLSAESEDEAANSAALEAINKAIDDVVASTAKYEQFADFIEGDLTAAIEKYADTDLDALSKQLASQKADYAEAVDYGSYTTEQIDAAMAALQPAVVAAITEAFEAVQADEAEHNLDITPILTQNLSFKDKSIEGWTCDKNAGKFESQVSGVCEVWHNGAVGFNAYTTLANMPAGVYEISAPAWYRDAGDMAAGYSNYTSDAVTAKSYFYANNNLVELLNQGDERLVAEEQDDIHNAQAEDGAYLPNGQAQAAKVFYESDIDVKHTVTTALTTAGDLTIGFKGDGFDMGTWTVWGAISVVYKGKDKAMILAAQNEAIVALVDAAAQLSENEKVANVAKADADLQTAIQQGEAAMETEAMAEKEAAIAALEAAIGYAGDCEGLCNQLEELHTLYAEYLLETVESSDETFPEMLVEIGDRLDGTELFESNEQIKEYTAALAPGFTAFVQFDALESASLEEPVDISAVIMNADFEDEFTGGENHVHYWNATHTGGGTGYQYGIYEYYNNDNFDINQTVKGLAEGYYRVRVQGFYRAGNNQDVADSLVAYGTEWGRNAELYANNYKVALKNPFERLEGDFADPAATVAGEGSEPAVKYGDIEEFYIPNDRNALQHYFENDLYWNELDLYVAKGEDLTLGLRKSVHVGGDWCPFDNFQLLYLGTTAPDAIEGVAADVVNTAAKSAAIYDLQGRRVQQAARGLYIIGGKKYIVK